MFVLVVVFMLSYSVVLVCYVFVCYVRHVYSCMCVRRSVFMFSGACVIRVLYG